MLVGVVVASPMAAAQLKRYVQACVAASPANPARARRGGMDMVLRLDLCGRWPRVRLVRGEERDLPDVAEALRAHRDRGCEVAGVSWDVVIPPRRMAHHALFCEGDQAPVALCVSRVKPEFPLARLTQQDFFQNLDFPILFFLHVHVGPAKLF